MSVFKRLRQKKLQKLGRAGMLPEPDNTLSPQDLFHQWFEFTHEAGIPMPEAMSVATTSGTGQPSTRMVLMKEYNQNEIVFYTNYDSRKGTEIKENNRVALLFHWKVLERQIRIEGKAQRIARSRSEQYFHSRDRLSQLGAHASSQSQPAESREKIEEQIMKIEHDYPDKIPLPENWGGFAVTPMAFEFWQGRKGRIHDRLCYELRDNQWQSIRLQP